MFCLKFGWGSIKVFSIIFSFSSPAQWYSLYELQLHILLLNRTEFRYFSLSIKTISLDLTEQLIGSVNLSKKKLGRVVMGVVSVCPWQMIVGRRFSFWTDPFSGDMLFFRGMGNGVVFLKPLRGLFFLPRNHPTDHWCCCTLKIPTGFTPPFCTRHGDFHDFEISYLFFQESKVPSLKLA